MNTDVTLAEAAFQYLRALSSTQQREEIQQEMNKFVRWCGKDRAVAALSPHEIADYAEGYAQPGMYVDMRLEYVREFLAYLKKQGVTQQNLAVHLRVPKKQGKRTAIRQHDQQTVELTVEGYARIREELEALKGRRALVAEELKNARADKDFRENSPLDAAREEQARLESRIRELENMLKSAQVVGERRGVESKAELGCKVILQDLSNAIQVVYTLVNPIEVNLKSGKISVESPLGKALLHRVAGEEVGVQAPAGIIRYRIERVER